jgi:hypothetical protein
MPTTKFVLAGMALALAGTMAIGVADASAKTKKQDEATSTQANATRPSDLGGSDRQLQGRFYKSSHRKAHNVKAEDK